MENSSRIVMESERIPSLVYFMILVPILARSWFGEGGDGLTYGLSWWFLEWFIHDIPHSCLEYGTGVTS